MYQSWSAHPVTRVYMSGFDLQAVLGLQLEEVEETCVI